MNPPSYQAMDAQKLGIQAKNTLTAAIEGIRAFCSPART
jgi:hypothetical protein